MYETIQLIILIAMENVGLPSILLAIFFIIFCVGASDAVFHDNQNSGGAFLLVGAIGTGIILYYFYNSYDLANHYVRAQWITYFNLKSAIGY